MASEQHAGDLPTDRAARTAVAGRPGRHGRPSALRVAVHARLEEMRFRRGILLMVTAGVLLVAAVGGIAMALTGGSDTGTPPAGGPPVADPRSTSASADPTGHARPSPRASSRRPKTSSSTVVGTTSPRPLPTEPATPSALPSRWPTGTDPPRTGPRWRDPRWRYNSPPPWWRHR